MGIGNHILAGVPAVIPTYTVATLPSSGNTTGTLAWVTDALNTDETTSNGTGNVGIWTGAAWGRIDDPATAIAA